MSPEERKAWGEKMKAAREAKKNLDKKEETIKTAPPLTNEPDIGDLQRQLEEMKQNQAVLQAALLKGTGAQQVGAQVTNQGIVGTHFKYTVDPNKYDDPVPRLFEYMESKPQLRRLGFRDNYELDFKMDSFSYDAKDGRNVTEPKFTLDLNRIVYDEDTFEPTNRRYTVCRMVFFEDPQTAMMIARDNGVDIDSQDEASFLNEMRFLRMKDWLLEAFYPPKPNPSQNKREQVIGNQMVEVWEISSENSAKIPFDQLNSKLKG